MSSKGEIFKTKEFISEKDEQDIRGILQEFVQVVKVPFHEIPSDTGKVILNKDGKLVAAADIKEEGIITYVPHTKCETISNMQVKIDSDHQVTLVKKLFPFCGFGAFVQWERQKKQTVCSSYIHRLLF